MSVRIAIISLSESFSDIWGQLAEFAGGEIDVAPRVMAVHSLQATAGVLIAAGGVESDAVPILRELRAANAPDAVVAGAETGHRQVISALRAGATNYFALPEDLGLCRSWFVDRVERFKNRKRVEDFAADERQRFDFSKMVGASPQLLAALKRTARVIPRGTTTVLIMGETGTGKELLARAIHYNSTRATGPFVEINCTALPETLLEAELFGYEPGAFTDARTSKPGLFEIAHGGTLFLDEIGDLSMPLQAKLLRVLEEKRVRRLGSIRDVEIDVRIIAATHVNLPQATKAGRFRQDLYYRLNVVPVRLPSLRERGDDVIKLAEHFIDRFSREYQVSRPSVTADIGLALRAHAWPGNVRELRNAIERAVLLGEGNLFVEDLFPDDAGPLLPDNGLPFPAPMRVIEQAAAYAMVQRCGGNKSEAAKILGISRKHLYSLLAQREVEQWQG